MNLAAPPGEYKVYHGAMTTTDAAPRPVLRLLLWSDDGDAALPLAEWRGALPASPELSLELRTDHRVLICDDWNFGPAGVVLEHVATALGLLRRGEDALVPSAVDDEPNLPLLLLRPSGASVLCSLLFADAPRDLHVDDVRRRRRTMTLPVHSFLDVPVDRGDLVDCLERECLLARALFGASERGS